MRDIYSQNFSVVPFGDMGIRIQLSTKISPEVNQWIRSFSLLLEKEKLPGVVEWIPTYTAITLFYDPCVISYTEVANKLMEIRTKLEKVDLPPAEIIHIPTCYGGEKGPDLRVVAEHNGLSEEEVIQIHCGSNYLIYMMGFTPGFPYLGGMSPQIATPRLSAPRAKVPAGSVGIAGEQTGIYSMETPGGWQLIGKTPVPLYDQHQETPILLKAGNYLKFVPISEEEFKHIQLSVKIGTYQVVKEMLSALAAHEIDIKRVE